MKRNLKLRLNKPSVTYIFLVFVFLSLLAFNSDSPYYFPINPGQANYLAGSMGELRGSHFHGGIDVKTGGRTGLEIYSTADGYVSRIKIQSGGYGNALYIYHPKYGTTSVYAHLESYRDDIAAYIRSHQYQKETFEIELFPGKDQFQVKRGELVAYSGNSGSSSGPHLHFEIRDSRQRPINPLDFGFSEIRDNIAPVVRYIGIRTLDHNSRVNDQFGTFEFDPYMAGGNYHISRPIEVHGKIGVMIDCYDQLNGVPNRNGVPKIKMTVDDTIVTDILINEIPFSKNRNLLVYRDHKMRVRKRRNYQKMYVEDGNTLNIFQKSIDKGILHINDTLDHKVRIDLTDAYGNTRQVNFVLRGAKPTNQFFGKTDIFEPNRYEVYENTLMFMAKRNEGNGYFAEVFANRLKYDLNTAYQVDGYAVYLWDLTIGIPDSIQVCGVTLKPGIEMMVPSETEFSYYQPHMDIQFFKTTLFDTLYLKTDYIDELESDREYFEIGDQEVPLRKNIKVKLKPKKDYPDKTRTRVYSAYNHRSFSYTGGDWQGDQITFYTRDLGAYTLLTDSVAPTIRMVANNRNNIMAYIKDELSGIKDFEVRIDGEWVLMNYDYKRNLIWSEKRNEETPFKGEMVIKVRDQVNNTKTYSTTIY
ncbi:MAG TPA: M23 family peptidase [Cytophagales bacterium]|jgi:hypothetical protein|nr:M23 family peptidase [Cytophagales bacterium]